MWKNIRLGAIALLITFVLPKNINAKLLDKILAIYNDKIITCVFPLTILDKSLTGKKPPEDISVKAKFNESKDLIEIRFKITNINNVIAEYNEKIFIACFNTSDLLNDIKFVKVFLKFSS